MEIAVSRRKTWSLARYYSLPNVRLVPSSRHTLGTRRTLGSVSNSVRRSLRTEFDPISVRFPVTQKWEAPFPFPCGQKALIERVCTEMKSEKVRKLEFHFCAIPFLCTIESSLNFSWLQSGIKSDFIYRVNGRCEVSVPQIPPRGNLSPDYSIYNFY